MGDLRALLDRIKLNEEKEKEEKKEKLGAAILGVIDERKNEAVKYPLTLKVNGKRPPTLVVTISGILHSLEEAEKEIEQKVMHEVVRDNMGFFDNNMRLVLDLRDLKDVQAWTLDAIFHRWGSYINFRAKDGKVGVVLPRDEPCRKAIESIAIGCNLKHEIVPDIVYKIVERSRDIFNFMDN